MPDKFQNFDPSKLKALKGTIITRQFQNRGISDGGLILPVNREKYDGVHLVLSVGEGVEDIKPGYVVMLNKGHGNLFEASGEFHNSTRYNEVLGIVKTPEDTTPYFRPIANNILIKLDKSEASKNGILIPERAQKDSPTASVVALGSYNLNRRGKKIPFNVVVGDRLYVKHGGATPITIDNEKFWLINEDNIVGRYEEVEA